MIWDAILYASLGVAAGWKDEGPGFKVLGLHLIWGPWRFGVQRLRV